MRVMRDLVGDLLSDRYRLISRVAGGGMGEVYRAHDLLLDRPVAVKVLQPTLASDPELVHRFRAEARAVARLSHPNIVAVHDWGSEDERTYYMVMEYVPGGDLRDVLVDNGALSPAQAAKIAASMCDALAEAHAAGIVHRDVKPENVLISRGGTVKVADFGIAAVADAERTSPGGAVSGTLRYLSPEQAAGDEVSYASDLWATGTVLAEMLTGRLPQAGGPEALRRRMLEDPTPPSALAPNVPAELDAIVLQACALDPAQRFAGAAAMGAALRRVLARSLPDAAPLSDLLFEATSEVRLADMEPTTLSHRKARKEAGDRRRRTLLLRAAGAIVALVLLAAGIAQAARSFGPWAPVQVPGIEGLAKTKAVHALESVGLRMDVVSSVHSLTVDRGAVITQTPHTGKLAEGSKVEVVLSRGPVQESVPSLAGADQAQAEVRLRAAGLHLGSVHKRYSLQPPGTVVSQQPSQGELPRGSAVSVVLSIGPRPVALPDVGGMTKKDATKKLTGAGFKVAVSKDYSNSVPSGDVIASSPGGGTTADEGSSVRLTVSQGPRWSQLQMPDVRGMTGDAAKVKLEALQLRPTIRSCGSGNLVVDTDPIAGTTIRQNAIVALFVCG